MSDIQVIEEFPARYDAAAARQHRWARGDWQLLPWILGRSDMESAARGQSRLPLIGRWKMLDNLRRTLSAPSAIAALIGGWFLGRGGALTWTAFVLLTIILPVWLPVMGGIIPRRAGITLRSHLHALRIDCKWALLQSAFLLVFLAHQAWLMSDAIVRTLYRLIVTRRNLLQWVTAAQTDLSSRPTLLGSYWRMGGAVLVALLAALAVWHLPHVWAMATPWIALWLVSPLLAVLISIAPRLAARAPLTVEDAQALRRIGRHTWRYFEVFVTAEDNWLPPDNFQEDPSPVLAHRTSPTNIGLYLLTIVSARDLGWIDTLESVQRLETTFTTLHLLQRYRGHFYNWYDTRDLRPLDPRYVSTVDSGNLAGHLLALANACREWRELPVDPGAAQAGVMDTLELAQIALHQVPDEQRTQSIGRQHLSAAYKELRAALSAGLAAQATACAATMLDIARALASELGIATGADVLFWAEATHRGLASMVRDAEQSAAARQPLNERLLLIESSARAFVEAMQFGFLLDHERRLLSIGFRVQAGTLDDSCYDLLASEARLASFLRSPRAMCRRSIGSDWVAR